MSQKNLCSVWGRKQIFSNETAKYKIKDLFRKAFKAIINIKFARSFLMISLIKTLTMKEIIVNFFILVIDVSIYCANVLKKINVRYYSVQVFYCDF